MLKELSSSPIVPVFFHPDAAYSRQILSACYQGGLRFFEFTNRGEEAPAVFAELKQHAQAHCPGLWLGIGTIYTAEEALQFIEAGADFVVQPIMTPEVGAVCQKRSMPWIPGAMSPTEVWAAWQAGATAVKIFPGAVLGTDYIRALRGPMPQVPLMVTGGVAPEADQIRQWLAAGVQAVGVGAQLFKGDFSSDYTVLARRIAGLLESITI